MVFTGPGQLSLYFVSTWITAMHQDIHVVFIRTYLYSSEKRVNSVVLWIHLNSSGQLPSTMHVSTSLFRSR